MLRPEAEIELPRSLAAVESVRPGLPLALPWRGCDATGAELFLRQGVRRDAVPYGEFLRTILHETPYMLQGPMDRLPEAPEQREFLEQLHALPNCICIVAVRFGRGAGREPILGSLVLLGGQTPRTRHAAQLSMGVCQSEWGRGLGGRLLDAGVSWARANPRLRRVGLQVYTGNVAARRLYTTRGFHEEGVLTRDVRDEQGWDDLVGMGLDLGVSP